MRQSALAVLERKGSFEGNLYTEPYEVGWASEAIFFIDVTATQDKLPTLDFHVQISPDGIRWVDEGAHLAGISQEGLYFIKVTRFGSWLRLAGSMTGERLRFELTVRLALKE